MLRYFLLTEKKLRGLLGDLYTAVVVPFGWHVQAQQEQSGVALRVEWDSA